MVYTADKTKLKTSVITMFSTTASTDAAFVYFAYIVGKIQ
jgi:hypothetical protein